MNKIITAVVATALLVVGGALAGTVLYRGNLAHVTMTIRAPAVSLVSIGVNIGTVDSLENFDSGLYDPAGKEIAIRNITFDSVVVYTENLSDVEKNALYDCKVYVKIYNATTTIIEGVIDALNETVLMANNVTGDWDVAIRVTGQAGLVEEEQEVAFDVVIDMDPIIRTTEAGEVAVSFDTWDPIESMPQGVNPDSIGVCVNGKQVPTSNLNIVQIGHHVYESNPIFKVYYNDTFEPGIYNMQFSVSDYANNTRKTRAFFIFT